MPVISVPTVQADTPVSAPGNPHGKDAVTFRGQPYLCPTIVGSNIGSPRFCGLEITGEFNGELYVDRIDIWAQDSMTLRLANLFGGAVSADAVALQPLNGLNSSGPAWGKNGIVTGDVSYQYYAWLPIEQGIYRTIELPYPALVTTTAKFGVVNSAAPNSFAANFYVRVVT